MTRKFFHNSIKRTVNPIINNYLKSVIRKHNFWFVDIPRTSSSSIRVELGNYFGIPYGKNNLVDKQYSSYYQFFHDHLRASEVKIKLGEKLWNNIFTFTIVRNPWDRIFSFYYYRKKCHDIPTGTTLKEYIIKLYNRQLGKLGLPLNSHDYYSCADYILDNGELAVDYIGRFETRTKDITIIANKIGWNRMETLHLQTTTPLLAQYKNYFDTAMIKMIEDLFITDITLFKYIF